VTKPVKIMPCLDMQNGRVVKGVHFINIRDAADPVESAQAYCAAGADELALLDITATVEGRTTMLEVVKRVAAATTVPCALPRDAEHDGERRQERFRHWARAKEGRRGPAGDQDGSCPLRTLSAGRPSRARGN